MAKPNQSKRSAYELKKLSDFWLDLSKLVMASLVFKFFEPMGIGLTPAVVVTLAVGLTLAVACAKVGLTFARKAGDRL